VNTRQDYGTPPSNKKQIIPVTEIDKLDDFQKNDRFSGITTHSGHSGGTERRHRAAAQAGRLEPSVWQA
jgi:hypothetical protein